MARKADFPKGRPGEWALAPRWLPSRVLPTTPSSPTQELKQQSAERRLSRRPKPSGKSSSTSESQPSPEQRLPARGRASTSLALPRSGFLSRVVSFKPGRLAGNQRVRLGGETRRGAQGDVSRDSRPPRRRGGRLARPEAVPRQPPAGVPATTPRPLSVARLIRPDRGVTCVPGPPAGRRGRREEGREAAAGSGPFVAAQGERDR
ncbi:uncharacterized protein [Oryctolagus cuniculus]|uniref:uncharacterized protein n=1 Tax=Oryctolagus cuniculus TaxID=9986 RepID=UPI00387A6FF3